VACNQEAQLAPDEHQERTTVEHRDAGVDPVLRDAAVDARTDSGSDADDGALEGTTEAAAPTGALAVGDLIPTELTPGLRSELCPFYTDEPLDIVNQPIALCAQAPVPLFHDDPEGEELEMFVKIIPIEGGPEDFRGVLWLLQGGPGAPGASLEHFARDLHDTFPGLEIMIPDHRGVGRSTTFECRETLQTSGGSVEDCAAEIEQKWGSDSEAFSITQGAYDVLHYASRFRNPDSEVILWGASYGATWAQRILQLDEEGVVTAAVLDSTAVVTAQTSLADNMLEVAESGDTLFAACAADEECSARLGDDPKARALEVLDNLCEPLDGEYRGRRWFQSMLSQAMRRWSTLRLVPPLIYRAERCDEEDVRFIERFYRDQSSEGGRGSYASAPSSVALLYNILFSELIPTPSSTEELEAAGDASVFADLWGFQDLVVGHEVWHTYERDEYMFKLADTDADLLILHGGLDTQTPPSMGRRLEAHFTADNHQYLFLPLGTHGVYSGSHTTQRPERFQDTPEGRYSCGAHLTLQFLNDPSSKVDGSCVDQTPPLEFTADEDTLIDLGGTDDPWGNP
jgi:pimeloyl-ACP methyl ester carboxylesterase